MLDVDGKLMSIIASIGVAVNVALAFVLGEEGHAHHSHGHHGHEHGDSHSHDHTTNDVADEKTHLLPPDVESQRVHLNACIASHDHGSHHESHEHNSHRHEHNHTNDHDSTSNRISPNNHDHAHNHTPSTTSKKEAAIVLQEASTQHETQRNINLHAAYLHVLGDLLQSIAVLIAGIVIWFRPTWTVIDPLCTLIFCCLVLYSTIGIFRSSLNVLLEQVPLNIDWNHVYKKITSVDGVSNVHDLHIWSVSHGAPALSVHLVARDPEQVLLEVSKICKELKIGHPTIQVQSEIDATCISCLVTNDVGNSFCFANSGSDGVSK